MTFGRSAAIFSNDARAALQSIVNGVGGRARSRFRLSNALHESMFTVTNASPVRRKRSDSRNKQMCPGECPGVCSHSQPDAPGIFEVCNSSKRPPKSLRKFGRKRERNAVAPPTVGSGGG